MNVPESALSLLKLREGFREAVYLDTNGLPTFGTGHLMSRSEIAQYPVGARVPYDVLTNTLIKDSSRAYAAAKNQATILKVTDSHFIDVLTSVNFQLGTAWFKDFRTTWGMLVRREYEAAAVELENSKWFRQTPTRVRDFQEAIRSLKKQHSV